MAHDRQLADRVRALIGDRDDLTEKSMFGGLAFLVGGNMAVAASGKGGLLVRVDPAESAALTAEEGVQPMQMRGREMTGWLRVEGSTVGVDEDLASWVRRGISRAESL